MSPFHRLLVVIATLLFTFRTSSGAVFSKIIQNQARSSSAVDDDPVDDDDAFASCESEFDSVFFRSCSDACFECLDSSPADDDDPVDDDGDTCDEDGLVEFCDFAAANCLEECSEFCLENYKALVECITENVPECSDVDPDACSFDPPTEPDDILSCSTNFPDWLDFLICPIKALFDLLTFWD